MEKRDIPDVPFYKQPLDISLSTRPTLHTMFISSIIWTSRTSKAYFSLDQRKTNMIMASAWNNVPTQLVKHCIYAREICNKNRTAQPTNPCYVLVA